MAAAARAEDAAVSTRLDLAYVSKYVWRGLVANPGPSLQPSFAVTHGSGLSVNVWGSGDLTGVNGAENRLTDLDYTLDYSTNLVGRSVNAGVIYYTFPNTSFHSTTEAYGAVCFDGSLATTLSANYDFDEAGGCYASATASCACPAPWQKGEPLTVDLSARLSWASAGYNAFYFGADKAAFTDLLITASLPLKLSGGLSLIPSLSYSRVLDSDLRDSVAAPDNLWLAVAASMSF